MPEARARVAVHLQCTSDVHARFGDDLRRDCVIGWIKPPSIVALQTLRKALTYRALRHQKIGDLAYVQSRRQKHDVGGSERGREMFRTTALQRYRAQVALRGPRATVKNYTAVREFHVLR